MDWRVICREICQPNRFKQAGFPRVTIDYTRFHAQKTGIRNSMTKNAPFRPVMKPGS